MRAKVPVVCLIALTLGPTALAGELSVGDAAPALEVSHWVQGDPVDLSAVRGKNIVVVEFWATWCGPCIAVAPHLSELQRQYADKGVIVVGVTKMDMANTLDTVKTFVRRRADRVQYRIAFDEEGKADAAFMDASGHDSIPTAFVIDRDGRLAWIGHPMDGLDDVLAEMTAGTYDLQLATRMYSLERQAEKLMGQAEDDKDPRKWSDALQLADQMIELRPRYFRPWEGKIWVYAYELNDTRKALETARAALRMFHDEPQMLANLGAVLSKNETDREFLELAATAVGRAIEIAPGNADAQSCRLRVLTMQGRDEEAIALAPQAIAQLKHDPRGLRELATRLSSLRGDQRCTEVAMAAVEQAIAADPDDPAGLQVKFDIVALCKGDSKAAEAVGRQFIDKASGDARMLNNFAWHVLTEDGLKGRFDALALDAAQRCHELSKGESWIYLDTLALAKFTAGQIDEAIALEEKAISVCDKEEAVAELREGLKRFEAAKTPR